MEIKYLSFVLPLSFLFLFYSSSFVFGEKPKVKKELWEMGRKNLKSIIKMEIKMAFPHLGTKTEKNGTNDTTKMEKKWP